MKFEEFKKIMDKVGRYIYIVDLFNWGEPLLNPDIYKMIGYAEKNNICTNIHTNFNIDFDYNVAERLILSGLSYLSISLDGADQQTYSIYRKNGDFQKVLNNIRLLVKLRNKLGKKKPFITWQFLSFTHNKQQIELARQLAKEMQLDSFQVLSGITANSLSSISQDSRNGASPMKDIKKIKCDWLWTTLTLHWDGAIGPCCLQFKKEDDFDKIDQGELKFLWNNKNFEYARGLFKQKSKYPRKEKIICNNCFKVTEHSSGA